MWEKVSHWRQFLKVHIHMLLLLPSGYLYLNCNRVCKWLFLRASKSRVFYGKRWSGHRKFCVDTRSTSKYKIKIIKNLNILLTVVIKHIYCYWKKFIFNLSRWVGERGGAQFKSSNSKSFYDKHTLEFKFSVTYQSNTTRLEH